MALSGKWTTLFASNAFELILTWSASQNIAGNSSSVTAILSIRGVNSWSTISDATASATSITINGNTKSFNVASSVNGGQTKELGRHTVSVPHNADGSKTVGINASHYWDINWSSTGYQTPKVGGNGTLNTIPRASTGSGTAFTFTANSAISISRASTAFTHKARFHVDGTFIKELTGLTTSGTFSFTDAERKNIVTKMANRTSVQCRVDLTTYNGSSQIGSTYQFTYNVTSPAKAGGTVADFTISTAGFPVKLTNYNTGAKFTYRATWIYSSMSNLATTPTSANFTFPLTQANVDTMLATTPNSNGTSGTLRVQSFFDGVQFGGNTDIKPINAKINTTVYAPDIKGGSTFKDTNETTVAVTGNNQIVVKSLSNVTVDIPAGLGTAKGGATLTKIRLSLGGTTKDVDYVGTATTLTLGATNASNNSNLNVSVIDSRGNIGTWTTPVTVLDYSKPTLSPVIERVGNYETSTEIILAGKYTRTSIDGVDKNTITALRYRYKQKSSTVWSSIADLPYTATGGSISSPPNTFINLDNTYSWDLEIIAIDKFTTTSTIAVVVPEGIPILFLDTEMKAIGAGMFPRKSDAFEVAQIIIPNGGFEDIRIPAGADLNDYKISGSYYNPLNAEAQTMSNKPTHKASAWSFNLQVMTHAGVTQIYREYQSTGFEYTRSYYNGTWTPWQITGGDSGWVRLNNYYTTNFKDYSTGRLLKYRRSGAHIHITGTVATKSQLSGAQIMLTNMPAEIRPADKHSAINQGSGTNTFVTFIHDNGTLEIDRYTSGDWPNNVWLNIDIHYMIG